MNVRLYKNMLANTTDTIVNHNITVSLLNISSSITLFEREPSFPLHYVG